MAIIDSNSTNSFLANMLKDKGAHRAWLGGSLKKTGWHWGEGKYIHMHLKYMSAFTPYLVRKYVNT